MSVYGYLTCKKCKDKMFVKDGDTAVHANRDELGEFLESHKGCSLKYLTDSDKEYEDFLDDYFESNATDDKAN